MSRGRFAPSPTGDLHVGNLRTALAAWWGAGGSGDSFVIRVEDLDLITSRREYEQSQLRDLASLGVTSSDAVVRQSERFDLYRDVIADLERRGLVYPCYCTRREIREAASAPHEPSPDGAYPGTCRELTLGARRERESAGRPPALRLRTDGETYSLIDLIAGPYSGRVDDVVIRRNDGVPAYNLAVVVDDHRQGVDQVVRGADLLSSTPRQMHLRHLLGYTHPDYAHVPLVVGGDGERLAKRHGPVTLADLAERSVSAADVRRQLSISLGRDPELADEEPFDWGSVPRHEWTIPLDWQT